jgi:hypothetical protein
MGGKAFDNGRSGYLAGNGSLYLTGAADGEGWPVKNAHQPKFAGGTGGWGNGDCILAAFRPAQTAPADDCIPLFEDTGFQQGFLLSYPSPSKGRAVETVLRMGENKKEPVWRLCQWATKYSLTGVTPTKNNMGGMTCKNRGKTVTVASPNLSWLDLILEIKGDDEYGQSPREPGQAWPHLLVEQDTSKIHTLDALAALDLSIGFKLLYCKNNMPPSDYNPDLHAAQFQLFLIVKNVEKTSNDFGDFFWFGVPFFDNRHEIPPPFVAKDGGKDDATGKLIYTIDGRKVNTTPPIQGKWITVEKNLLPYIKSGLKGAAKRGYLSDSALDHYAVANMNLGWEIPGNFNASAAVRDFNVCAMLKK